MMCCHHVRETDFDSAEEYLQAAGSVRAVSFFGKQLSGNGDLGKICLLYPSSSANSNPQALSFHKLRGVSLFYVPDR